MKITFQKMWAVVTAAVLLAALALPAFAAQDLQQTCDEATAGVTAAILYDMTNDVILYEKNADRHVAIGSVTKVLNACTAVRYLTAGDQITVGDEIYLLKSYASRAPIAHGEKYTFEQLLHAMLIPSGCDAAYVIADMVGRLSSGQYRISASEAVRCGVAEMNRTLERLGCTDSHFVNPDGQDADGQYTTCRDYLKVLCCAMNDPLIRSVVGKYAYSCTDVYGNYHSWTTTNSMINPNSAYYYSGAIGIKTGSADAAGCCLALAAERDGRTVISFVVNAASYDARYTVTRKLMDAAFASSVANQGGNGGSDPGSQGGTTPAPQTGLSTRGDLDGDGMVTPSDARLTLRIAIRLEDASRYDLSRVDLDGDRYITPADARLVLRLAVGLDQ